MNVRDEASKLSTTDKDTEIKQLKEDRDAWKKYAKELEEKCERLKSEFMKSQSKSDTAKVLYWRTKYYSARLESKKTDHGKETTT